MPEKVRLISDPALRVQCTRINVSTYPIDALLTRMYDTMCAERGIGLAANQIGETVQVFILKYEDSYQEYINPSFTILTDLVDFEGEACLSIPGTSATTKRYKVVGLNWQDRNGKSQYSIFTDLRAFAVQHEMDHLQGKLFIDAFGSLKRDLVLGKHRKYLREIRRR